jgi:polyphosphate kinase 2
LGVSTMAKHKGSKKDHKESKKNKRLDKKLYEDKIEELQTELVRLQEWVKAKGLKVVVVFEGRDAAGKGGVIKRITERVSPRVFRVVALPAPSDREKTQFYYQRYLTHLPAAGEVVLFDRSWYNRAGVERVMGFCTEAEYKEFMLTCPGWEQAIVRSGIILIKYWLTVRNEEQEKRFQDRIDDPRKQWKLSPMDVEARRRWYDYAHARDDMLDVTDTGWAPWYIVDSNDKRRARLNSITHFLNQIPYEQLPEEEVDLPKRSKKGEYDDEAALVKRRWVPEIY